MPPRVLIIGARTARQGTGPFIARAFAASGADVCAILGTHKSTVEEAREALAREHNIICEGYTDLQEALVRERPDIVAISSPYQYHAEQLTTVARAGCHCLVEKPLVWPASEAQLKAIIQEFTQRGTLLQLVTQWPQTLSSFTELHGPIPKVITHFAMRLSPTSLGPNMVPDSAPHFISLLQALLGPGVCEPVAISFPDADEQAADKLTLKCQYRHGAGTTRAQLQLETCETRPRPAWYQINQLRADREVQLPEYVQQLVANGQTVTMDDPLDGVVADFLTALANRTETETSQLLAAHRNLLQLASAWPKDS